MSKGWRARLRRKRCAHFRAARSCRPASERSDDRQASLFAAPPSFCVAAVVEPPGFGQIWPSRTDRPLRQGESGDGCSPRAGLIPWCEVLDQSERAAVRAALLELRAARAAARGE